MKLKLIVLLIFLSGCIEERILGEYESFWGETHYLIDFKQGNNFDFEISGHRLSGKYSGKFRIENDTLRLVSNELQETLKTFIVTNDSCLMELSSGYDFCKNRGSLWHSNRINIKAKHSLGFNKNKIRLFPKPNLSEILKFYETSGAVGKKQSIKYFNPDINGIFVFYTLFDKNKSENSISEIGSLITHTFYKDSYGWGASDKDQSFVEIYLHSDEIKIGSNLMVGANLSNITKELGIPILLDDYYAVFVGKENYLCKVSLSDNIVTDILYGVYNFSIKDYDSQDKLREEIKLVFSLGEEINPINNKRG